MIAENINVNVQQGELVALVGVNGVGKSTFLRTLSGVQPPLDGSIAIAGKNRNDLSAGDLSSLISVVLTEQPVSGNLSVFELVALGRQPYTNWIGKLTTQDVQEIRTALAMVGIEYLQQRRCFELSDGQLQKVLIARALAQQTPIIILDEPTSHLDLYHKAQVLRLLKRLSQETNRAILFATHEINLALQLCDKMVLMKSQTVAQGTPQELITKNVFEDMFPSDLIIFDKNSGSFKIKT